MSFKRKMIIAFAIIFILPLVLMGVSFVVIGNYMSQPEGSPHQVPSYQDISSTLVPDSRQAEQIYEEIYNQLCNDSSKLEDDAYLSEISSELENVNSFLIVRKGNEIYYTDNEIAAGKILADLPAYQGESGNHAESRGSYMVGSTQEAVKQLDFTFTDGSEGSVFIVTKVFSTVSRGFIIRMMIAILLIMSVTSFLLIRWMNSGLIRPIHNLDVAMDKIRDGSFDYVLPTDQKGEIGDLYRSYEDMRLRLKESAEEKMEQEKANSELIRNISHDLKTPITSVKGYVEGLMDGVANTPEKQHKYLQIIYNKTIDMDRLINELTLYSKIDNDRIPYNFRKINVADYFGDCVEEIGVDMDSRGIKLNYSNLVSPNVMIIADPEQLKRVINNIISNSVKYMDKNQQWINIRILDEQQDAIRIEIEDNGKGIAARDLPNIFDRFYRTDSSRTSATGGSGIGLSIVKKIVEDHGGYIWATSTEGQGTCMHLVLRKYTEPQDDAESIDSSAS